MFAKPFAAPAFRAVAATGNIFVVAAEPLVVDSAVSEKEKFPEPFHHGCGPPLCNAAHRTAIAASTAASHLMPSPITLKNEMPT